MLDLRKTAVDPTLLETGVWWTVWATPSGQLAGKPVGDELDQEHADRPCIRIAPSGPALDRAIEQERDRIAVDPATIDDAQAAVIMGRALAHACVRDWRNIGIDGTVVPFTVEEAARMLSMPELQSLREFVAVAANNRRAILQKQEKADTGN
jgi:hypothetical protein